ncbi:DNA-binding protein [Bacillus anthracis]|uniref:helix-turn-helix domain-containing protein n=1 Tax=Bacillus cereus group sp. TH160LC TaxID=3018058 RepID=UPI000BF86435|nr:helix-turn-helix domain-containing protein [Bacillus cereus group sp. TH160LC]MDA1652517.1 helix-turn-helix domain-containing protein [Bacillus cereus group sp. TH160LC]PES24056.1 DNA-binding protein [Bacillus anthracis]PGR29939.1 DNA-binding protein [Bacillus anthracis]
MPKENPNEQLSRLIKKLLKERALSMRQLGMLTNIDPATISRIMNGKQPPKQKHLQKFAECLQVPPQLLFDEMYPDSPHINKEKTDMYTSLDTIQQTLQSSNLFDFDYTTTRVKQELENYERYAQTTEGEKRIHESFASKLEQIDSAGPFIEQLTDMYQQFCNETIPKEERAVLGGALLYFILSTDIIPDYLFPIGYLDDAIAVELAKEKLIELKRKT